MTQQQEEEREADSRSERQQVSIHVLRPQFPHKEERHANHTRRYRYQIARSKLFFIEQRLEDQNINRRRVLQKDRIGSSSEFGGRNEKNEQRRVKDRGDRADAVQTEAFLSSYDGNGDRRQQRTPEREFERGKMSGFDEKPAGAP